MELLLHHQLVLEMEIVGLVVVFDMAADYPKVMAVVGADMIVVEVDTIVVVAAAVLVVACVPLHDYASNNQTPLQ